MKRIVTTSLLVVPFLFIISWCAFSFLIPHILRPNKSDTLVDRSNISANSALTTENSSLSSLYDVLPTLVDSSQLVFTPPDFPSPSSVTTGACVSASSVQTNTATFATKYVQLVTLLKATRSTTFTPGNVVLLSTKLNELTPELSLLSRQLLDYKNCLTALVTLSCSGSAPDGAIYADLAEKATNISIQLDKCTALLDDVSLFLTRVEG